MISDDFKEILDKYSTETSKPFKNSKFGLKMDNEFNNELNNFLENNIQNFNEYETRLSRGLMNIWVKTPWAGIRNKKITTSFSRGLFIIYEFDLKNKGVLLSINQGTNGKNRKKISSKILISIAKELSDNIIEKNGFLSHEVGKKFDNLKLSSKTAIISKYYHYDELNNEVLKKDLKNLIDIYEKIIPYYTKLKKVKDMVLKGYNNNEIAEKFETTNVWLLSPGEVGRYWNEFREGNFIAIGWGELGDLSKYNNVESLQIDLEKKYPKQSETYNAPNSNKTSKQPFTARGLYNFYKEMNPGDLVFIKKGIKTLVGIGVIKSDYEFLKDSIIPKEDYNHIRKIEWIKTGEFYLPDSFGQFNQKTLTNITNLNYKSFKGDAFYKELLKIMNISIDDYIDEFKEESENIIQNDAEFDRLFSILKETNLECYNPDLYDGSYKLVDKTVRYLSKLDSEEYNISDMDMLYLMTIGTWQHGWDKKQNKISESSLKKEDKYALSQILNDVKLLASNKSYTTSLEKNNVGMFGTGFMTFNNNMNNKDVIKFLKMCVDIQDLEDIDEIFEKVEMVLKDGIKGMGVASVSQILHCLKPFIFPIINGAMKNDTKVYEKLGIELQKPVSEDNYINNSRIIQNIKNEKFNFVKNYRAFDILNFYINNEIKCKKYTKEDFLNEVVFLEKDYDKLVNLLKRKKNIILQGSPGVGKSFISKKLAYSIIGAEDENRVEFVQFHQNYSYEDFIQGYRPIEKGFELKDGIFYNFCMKAIRNPDKDYFFIIDEINRGNISKIFGELMMLIEEDKRGKKFGIHLTYSDEEPKFYVPENLYIIGMMNTADRSLAIIDYALRRRFVFCLIPPLFDEDSKSTLFKEYLTDNGVSNNLATKIIERFKSLNKKILEDENLGYGFRIGHSYFCGEGRETENGVFKDELWYKSIIKYEIEPLLNEYWFDELNCAEEEIDKLLSNIE